MKKLFKRYLSGDIDENHLLEHIKFDTLDHLNQLLLEMFEVSKDDLKEVLLFWFDELQTTNYDNTALNRYIRELKRLQDTRSLSNYETEELIEILLNFMVIQRFADMMPRHLEVGKNIFDRPEFSYYRVEHGYVVMLTLKDFGLTSINQIDGIQFLKRLKSLDLSWNNIKKVEGLETLVELEDLILGDGDYLMGNEISKIEGLDTLTKLKYLDLSFNHIKRIEGLEHLENLEDLYLTHNQITEIEGLESLKNLREIDLLENPVDDTMDIQALFKQFKNLEVVSNEGRK